MAPAPHFSITGWHAGEVTLAFNTCAGGTGGMGGAGGPAFVYVPPGPNGSAGLGIGALYDASGQCDLTNCTVAFNPAPAGESRPTVGHGQYALAPKPPGGQLPGTITDLGHNLSSDATCAFTKPAA